MRRTASEIINDLEMRVASLEKQAIFGLFKKKEEVTIASEEKLLESHVKATRGVSDVSIDLSNKKKITMDVRFHGVHFHFVGKCIQDLERVYDGYYKSANPSLFLMQRARSTGRSPSVGGGGRMGGIGNIYSFQHGDTFLFYLHTDSGEIYRKNNDEIYESLSELLSKKSNVKQARDLERQASRRWPYLGEAMGRKIEEMIDRKYPQDKPWRDQAPISENTAFSTEPVNGVILHEINSPETNNYYALVRGRKLVSVHQWFDEALDALDAFSS